MHTFTYADITSGVTVRLRDGRTVVVTDAADQNPTEYVTLEEGPGRVIQVFDELPVETILVGTAPNGKTVVTDMSEVVRILN